MHNIFKQLLINVSLSGNLKEDIHLFLTTNHCSETASHCLDVGTESRRLAIKFGADPDAAEIAGLLHDISAVFPNSERISTARELNIEVLLEEEMFPMIIHQKISKVMAKEIFNISNPEILDAIGCHTTLRGNSTLLDKVLFVADKIAWDQAGQPPYILELRTNLESSLTLGAFTYINFLWQQRDKLKVIHPWLEEAYYDLKP